MADNSSFSFTNDLNARQKRWLTSKFGNAYIRAMQARTGTITYLRWIRSKCR